MGPDWPEKQRQPRQQAKGASQSERTFEDEKSKLMEELAQYEK